MQTIPTPKVPEGCELNTLPIQGDDSDQIVECEVAVGGESDCTLVRLMRIVSTGRYVITASDYPEPPVEAVEAGSIDDAVKAFEQMCVKWH